MSSYALVTHVADGDTIRCALCDQVGGVVVELLGSPFTVRIRYVDAPEYGQPAYSWCNQQARAHLLNRVVELRRGPLDRYGRLVSEVFDLQGRSVGADFCRRGIAVVYTPYGADKTELLEAEEFARAHELGLWHYHPVVKPWDFRHLTRGVRRDTNAQWKNRGRP